jgi:hypothetical protein
MLTFIVKNRFLKIAAWIVICSLSSETAFSAQRDPNLTAADLNQALQETLKRFEKFHTFRDLVVEIKKLQPSVDHSYLESITRDYLDTQLPVVKKGSIAASLVIENSPNHETFQFVNPNSLQLKVNGESIPLEGLTEAELGKRIQNALPKTNSSSAYDFLIPRAEAFFWAAVIAIGILIAFTGLLIMFISGFRLNKAAKFCEDIKVSSVYREGPKNPQEKEAVEKLLKQIGDFQRKYNSEFIVQNSADQPIFKQLRTCLTDVKKRLDAFLPLVAAPKAEGNVSPAK